MLSDHFQYSVYNDAPYTVQILEKLDDNGRNLRGALDPSIISKRKQKEKEWMLNIQGVFPYRLIV